MVNVVKNWPGLHKISFVAHSLGGLIARYAIGRLFELSARIGNADQNEPSSVLEANNSAKLHELCYEARIAGLEPVNFITFATPHLGSRGHKQVSSVLILFPVASKLTSFCSMLLCIAAFLLWFCINIHLLELMRMNMALGLLI